MNLAPRRCIWGCFACGLLSGVILSLASIFFTARQYFHGPDAGLESLILAWAIGFVGPIVSLLLALVSFWRGERPRWPAILCVVVALGPLSLWLQHLWALHRLRVINPKPNHAFQRTEVGDRVGSEFEPWLRQPLSLGLEPLGDQSSLR